MNPETAKSNTNLPRIAAFAGALISSAVVFGGARYALPPSNNLLIQSGPHAAAGLVMGAGANLVEKLTNGKERFTLGQTVRYSILAGLAGLAINVAFEYLGHPLERLVDHGSYLKGRKIFTAYGDWKVDNLFAAAGSFFGFLLTEASVEFGSSQKKLKWSTSFRQPQR